LGLHNIDRFLSRRKLRKKESPTSLADNNNSSVSIPKDNWTIIIIGIIIAAIGFAGAIFYGSQFVKEEVSTGATLQYTNPSQTKNVLPVDSEIVFVAIGAIGFGIFTYGFARRVDKPFDFYPI
jgi:hypothetical protein